MTIMFTSSVTGLFMTLLAVVGPCFPHIIPRKSATLHAQQKFIKRDVPCPCKNPDWCQPVHKVHHNEVRKSQACMSIDGIKG